MTKRSFFHILSENQNAVQVMGDDKLKVIAHELLVSLREDVSVDGAHRFCLCGGSPPG